MGKSFRFDPETIEQTRREQREAREAQRAAEWNRDAKTFDAWSMDRLSYEDELNAFVDRNVPAH